MQSFSKFTMSALNSVDQSAPSRKRKLNGQPESEQLDNKKKRARVKGTHSDNERRDMDSDSDWQLSSESEDSDDEAADPDYE